MLEDRTVASKWFEKFRNLEKSEEFRLIYNWDKLSDEIRERETKTEAAVEVSSGSIQGVYQVVGYCGQSSIRTEMFFIETVL